MSKGEKNAQPDRDSNPGPFAYRANALPSELSGRLHISSPISDKDLTVTYHRHSFVYSPEKSNNLVLILGPDELYHIHVFFVQIYTFKGTYYDTDRPIFNSVGTPKHTTGF